MAVYTKLEPQEISNFLQQYNIYNFKDYKGITEGVENTNYFIRTSEQDYILTIYEKRVAENDLPFFIKLLSILSEKRFPCPKPGGLLIWAVQLGGGVGFTQCGIL